MAQLGNMGASLNLHILLILGTLESPFIHRTGIISISCLSSTSMSSWPNSGIMGPTFLSTCWVTFYGLFTALCRCPHLQGLHILVDVVKIDINPTAKSFQHATLGTSGLLSSLIEDAERLSFASFSTCSLVSTKLFTMDIRRGPK
ncbi:uncharacterized protein HD556DRAFT_1372302 [Suillus plorans]|uniref:Uncharacterized protein n=1 Tax=Suillus plorans TaxID=116603 RepID=A0A9P7ARH7_9AGAM|nr:uncharacterized protein HD556DRAFT_1372302 [Suillus plorans]KAG1793894.1 hypothetical protein HD556DRAFT_1372302 [Suillus plorans]